MNYIIIAQHLPEITSNNMGQQMPFQGNIHLYEVFYQFIKDIF